MLFHANSRAALTVIALASIFTSVEHARAEDPTWDWDNGTGDYAVEIDTSFGRVRQWGNINLTTGDVQANVKIIGETGMFTADIG